MRNRILAIALTLLLLHVAVLPIFTMHYCQGKLEATSNYGIPKSCCSEPLSHKQTSKQNKQLSQQPCCSYNSINLIPIQEPPTLAGAKLIQTFQAQCMAPVLKALFTSFNLALESSNHSPPQILFKQAQTIHILNCQYRI